MAPELVNRIGSSNQVKKFKYGSKVDIWALGITLFQMVLLQVPNPYQVNAGKLAELKQVMLYNVYM